MCNQYFILECTHSTGKCHKSRFLKVTKLLPSLWKIIGTRRNYIQDTQWNMSCHKRLVYAVSPLTFGLDPRVVRM
jgi:hypothetical protein